MRLLALSRAFIALGLFVVLICASFDPIHASPILSLLDDDENQETDTVNSQLGTLFSVSQPNKAARVTSDADKYVITIPNFLPRISANYKFIIDMSDYFSLFEGSTCTFQTVDYSTTLTVSGSTVIHNLFGQAGVEGVSYTLTPPNFISREIAMIRPGAADTSGKLTCLMRSARYTGDFSENFMKVTLVHYQLVSNAKYSYETSIDGGSVTPLVLTSGHPVSLGNSEMIPAMSFNLEDISILDARATMSAIFPMAYKFLNDLIPAGDSINVLMPFTYLDHTDVSEYRVDINGVRIPSEYYSVSSKPIFFTGDSYSFTVNDAHFRLQMVTFSVLKDISYSLIASTSGSLAIEGFVHVSVRITNVRPQTESYRRTYNFCIGKLFMASLSSGQSSDIGTHYMITRSASLPFASIDLPRVPVTVTAPDGLIAGAPGKVVFTIDILEVENNAATGNLQLFDLNIPTFFAECNYPKSVIADDPTQQVDLTKHIACTLASGENDPNPAPAVAVIYVTTPLDPNQEKLFSLAFLKELQPDVPAIVTCNFTMHIDSASARPGPSHRSFFHYRGCSFFPQGKSVHCGAINFPMPAIAAPVPVSSVSASTFTSLRSLALNVRNPVSGSDLLKIYLNPIPSSAVDTALIEFEPVFTMLKATSTCVVLQNTVNETSTAPSVVDTDFDIEIFESPDNSTTDRPPMRGLRVKGIFSRNNLVVKCTGLDNDIADPFDTHGPYFVKMWTDAPADMSTAPAPTFSSRTLMLSGAERAANFGSPTASSSDDKYPDLINHVNSFAPLASIARFVGSSTSSSFADHSTEAVGVGFASLAITLRNVQHRLFRMKLEPNKRMSLNVNIAEVNSQLFVISDLSKANVEIYATLDDEFPSSTTSLKNLWNSGTTIQVIHRQDALSEMRIPLVDMSGLDLFPSISSDGLGQFNVHIRIRDILRTDFSEIKNMYMHVGFSPFTPTNDITSPYSMINVKNRIAMAPFIAPPASQNNNKAEIVVGIANLGVGEGASGSLQGTGDFTSITLSYISPIYEPVDGRVGVAPNDITFPQHFRMLGDRLEIKLPPGLLFVPGRSLCSQAGRVLSMEIANVQTPGFDQTLRTVFNYDYNAHRLDGKIYVVCSNLKSQGFTATAPAYIKISSSMGKVRAMSDLSAAPLIRAPLPLASNKNLLLIRSADAAGTETDLTLSFRPVSQIRAGSYFRLNFTEFAPMWINFHGITRCSSQVGDSAPVNGKILPEFLMDKASLLFQLGKGTFDIPIGAQVTIVCTHLRNSRNLRRFNLPTTSRVVMLQVYSSLSLFASSSVVDTRAVGFELPLLVTAPFGGSDSAIFISNNISSSNVKRFAVQLSPLNTPNIQWNMSQRFTVYVPPGWSINQTAQSQCTVYVYTALTLLTENLGENIGDPVPDGYRFTLETTVHANPDPVTYPRHETIPVNGIPSEVPDVPYFVLTTTALQTTIEEWQSYSSDEVVIVCSGDQNGESYLIASPFASEPLDKALLVVLDASFYPAKDESVEGSPMILAADEELQYSSCGAFVYVPEIVLIAAQQHIYWEITLSNPFPMESGVILQYVQYAFPLMLATPQPPNNMSNLAQAAGALWKGCFNTCFTKPVKDHPPANAPLTERCYPYIPSCGLLDYTLRSAFPPDTTPADAAQYFMGLCNSPALQNVLKTKARVNQQVVKYLNYYFDKCADGQNSDKKFCDTYDGPPATAPSIFSTQSEVVPDENSDACDSPSTTQEETVMFTLDTVLGSVLIQGTQSMADQAKNGTYVVTDELLDLIRSQNSGTVKTRENARKFLNASPASASLLNSFQLLADEDEEDKRYVIRRALTDSLSLTWDTNGFPMPVEHFLLYLNAIRNQIDKAISHPQSGIQAFIKNLVDNVFPPGGLSPDPVRLEYAKFLQAANITALRSKDASTSVLPSECEDTVVSPNVGETDKDCGGAKCNQCAIGKSCVLNRDCSSNACDKDTLKCVDFRYYIEEKPAVKAPRDDKIEMGSSASSFTFYFVVALVLVAMFGF